MRRRLLASCAVVAALGAVGCKSLESGATETFAREYSCPEDRVQARERPDVTGSSLVMGPPSAGTPPAEVAKDPGRLARWRADQAAEQSSVRDVYDSMTVFEVNGCGHKAFYACKRLAKVQGGADPIGCVAGRHPPP